MRKLIKYMEKGEFRTLDLFAGVGGIRLGFENAGCQRLPVTAPIVEAVAIDG